MTKGVTAVITIIALIASIFLASAPATADTGHIKLLAVYQEGDTFKGSPADVQLEIKKGTGRVFLETIPLSKVDTQISTRFAKEIACKFAETDCNKRDFFYTIKSPAGIVGGPSAGSAISALTFSMLKGLELDQNTAMTGTINSGGLVGPVGSLREKINAASDAGITTVIIPIVQAGIKEDNVSIIDYGAELGVEIVPVGTLEEAVEELTGERFEDDDKDIDVPQSYKSVMTAVSQELCDRTEELIGEVNVFNLTGKKKVVFEWVRLQEEAQNLTRQGRDAFEQGNTYSAASYCFGANVKAHTLLNKIMNMTPEQVSEESQRLKQKIDNVDKQTEERGKETITDLQTYMIVKERILEARQSLSISKNTSENFGYVDERLNSAVAWSKFFGNEGEKYNIEERALQQTCTEILGDVEERFQYLNLFFPGLLKDLQNNLLVAEDHYQKGEYGLCIYLASRTKAESNIIVTLIGVTDESVQGILEQKLKAAKRAINKQIESGIFPIIAYSYYEYATSLQEDNKEAALLYSEYALELSEIDIYFEKKASQSTGTDTKNLISEYMPTAIFLWGMILGFLLALIITRRKIKTGKKESWKPRSTVKTKTRLRIR